MTSTRPELSAAHRQEVLQELDRLLQDPAFRSSRRCRDFLQFVVDKTLNGQFSELKERSIGVDLFGLPHDFDTSQHTTVRVTASELRKKLAQCYQALNGAHQGVRIELPSGSYHAEFVWPSEAPAATVVMEAPPATVSAAPSTPAPSRRGWLVATVGAIAAGGAYWQWQRQSQTAAAVMTPPAPLSPLPGPADAVRIGAGLKQAYLDRNGQTWQADRFATGGRILERPSEKIARTLDPDLYRHARVGEFRYDIPLSPGNYELRLHFAETSLTDFISAESSGEGQRLFRVSANGKTLLDFFDIVADAAGACIANERVFRNLSPGSDGLLHLAFSPLRGSAMVSGIELNRLNGAEDRPLRIRSGWPTAWRDAQGRNWRADAHFLGGNALVRRTNPAHDSAEAGLDPGIYASERWGHFSYALPAAPGRYQLTLKFCEGHLGPRNSGRGGVGGRVFDVHCNGNTILKEFDILREAGREGQPVDRVFQGLSPNAQGKILLTFVPVEGMACVNAIELARSSG